MRGLAILPAFIAALAGCGVGGRQDSKRVLALQGPGGIVTIGESIESAKKAFPPPKGAELYDSALAFSLLGQNGWGWMTADGEQAFEAATKNGKIVGLSLSDKKDKGTRAVEQTIAEIGEPTRKAESENGALYIWESGEYARFYMRMKTTLGPLGGVSGTLIGPKEDLKLLNFRYDDPEVFIRQIDLAAKQLKSGKPNPVFERAKQKALEKRRKGK